jgi:hypothetical protein
LLDVAERLVAERGPRTLTVERLSANARLAVRRPTAG